MDESSAKSASRLRAQWRHGAYDGVFSQGGRTWAMVQHFAAWPPQRCVRVQTNAFYDSPALKFHLDGKSIETDARRYEVLEPSTATVLASFTNVPGHLPALTLNRFGEGKALYLATESNASAMGPVASKVLQLAGIQRGPATPDGVYARVIEGRTLYVNTTSAPKNLPLGGSKRGILTNRVYNGTAVLGPLEADLLQ